MKTRFPYPPAPILAIAISLLSLSGCNRQPEATSSSNQGPTAVPDARSAARTQRQAASSKAYSPRVYSEQELQRLLVISKRMEAALKKADTNFHEGIDSMTVHYYGFKTREELRQLRARARDIIGQQPWLAQGKNRPIDMAFIDNGPPVYNQDDIRAQSYGRIGLKALRAIDSTLYEASRTRDSVMQALQQEIKTVDL